MDQYCSVVEGEQCHQHAVAQSHSTTVPQYHSTQYSRPSTVIQYHSTTVPQYTVQYVSHTAIQYHSTTVPQYTVQYGIYSSASRARARVRVRVCDMYIHAYMLDDVHVVCTCDMYTVLTCMHM